MQKLENKNRTVDIFHLSKQEMHENILFLFNSLGDFQIFFFNTVQLRQKSRNELLAYDHECVDTRSGASPFTYTVCSLRQLFNILLYRKVSALAF